MPSKKISYPALPWGKGSSEGQQTPKTYTPQPARVSTRPPSAEAEAAEARIAEWRARRKWGAVRK